MRYINSNKLKQIKLHDNNFYIAIDFDKTITAVSSSDSWDASGGVLGEEFKKEAGKIYQKYAPIELDYNISYEEKNKAMQIWYTKTMGLYYKYNLTEEKLIESIDESELIFRDGAKEFLTDMHNKNIPMIILSAGIGNVIERFLKKNNCYYSNMTVISNFISFDEQGKMKKYEDPIIHTLNKNLATHMTQNIKEKIEDKNYRLLFGDFVEDKNMVPKKEWDKTISIGFLDKKVEENLEIFNKNFDIVLTRRRYNI